MKQQNKIDSSVFFETVCLMCGETINPNTSNSNCIKCGSKLLPYGLMKENTTYRFNTRFEESIKSSNKTDTGKTNFDHYTNNPLSSVTRVLPRTNKYSLPRSFKKL